MADIVILGAGLTGLSTAYHLEQQGFYDYKLFEKDVTVGGLCRSIQQDGFTFDYTGHLLHVNNTYFKELLEKIVGLNHFNTIFRRSFVYSQDKYTLYPFQVNLYGLPTNTIVECIEGFLSKPKTKVDPKNFYQWVMQNFGAGLGKHFFFTYQEKIFSYDIKKLSATWTGRFVPNTTLTDLIKGAISDRSHETFGYNAQFFYPKHGGIQSWVTKLAATLENKIYTHFCVQSVDLKNKRVTFTNGHSESYNTLISTIPLDILLKNSKEADNTTLKRAASKLLCNSVLNFNLGINREQLSNKHWIYYPETKYPFYRIGFPHNFSDFMAPPGCSSLYGEFSYLNQPSSQVSSMLEQALASTKNLFSITDQEIISQKIIDIKYAYVIYNAWRDKHVPVILKLLLDSYGVHSIGRYGAWKYSSMQEAVLDGKAVAEKVATYSIPYTTHYQQVRL